MSNLTDNLPDLMHRATTDLEPESLDLYERSLKRGQILRRRRTVRNTLAGAGAVLATAAVVVGASSALGGAGGAGDDLPVAGQPAPARVETPAATPEKAAATLKKLLPANLRVSSVHTETDPTYGAINVDLLVDDGTGPAQVTVRLGSTDLPPCADKPGRCQVRKDGSTITVGGDIPGKVDPSGLRAHHVLITHRDRTFISVGSNNTTSNTAARPTRPQPVLSVEQLTAIADSTLWLYPPAPKR
jgi:hypothetical protein